MKKFLISLFLMSAAAAQAQNFEGIISWKITSEFTDPKYKAEMEAAEQKINDPATQAQMKEMQEKMNDPEFKKMLDSNPQLKAQMEAAMKMVQGGGGLNSLMPKGYTIKLKNQSMLSSMDGGMMANMEFLYLSDKEQSYRIDREAKTYSPIPKTKEEPSEKMDVKVTKTSETARILNYNCTKYLVQTTIKGQTMDQAFWTTNEIKGIDFKSLSKQRFGDSSQKMYYEQIEGVPLKMEMKTPQALMTMEVTDIKKQSLPASDFAIPSGFKEVPLKF